MNPIEILQFLAAILSVGGVSLRIATFIYKHRGEDSHKWWSLKFENEQFKIEAERKVVDTTPNPLLHPLTPLKIIVW